MENETQTEETGSEQYVEQSDDNLEPEQAEGQEPELQASQAPQTTAQTAPVNDFQYRSPYINVPQQNSQVPPKYAHVLDDTQYAALREMASEIAEERVGLALQAQAQQRAAARKIGLPEAFINEYGDDMRRHEMSVPPQLRGTKEGAMLSLNAAIAERMMSGGDIKSALRQAASFFEDDDQQTQVRAPQGKTPLPPDQRMSTPKTASRPVSNQRGQQDDAYSRLRSSWGANEEEMRALMEASDEVGTAQRGRR